MVESQVGFLAANIPSMGPLFGRVSNTAKMLRDAYVSRSLKHESHGSTKHTVPQRESNRGFERMLDDVVIGVKATAQPGSPSADNGFVESIPMNEIVVETNLERDGTHLSSCGGL